MHRFTFNKKARCVALAGIKKFEAGSFVSAVLGSFSSNPRLTATTAVLMFALCRIGEIFIAGIEDDVPCKRATPRRK